MNEITQKELTKILKYDPASGLFVWRITCNGFVKKGDTAGYLDNTGYLRIAINRRRHQAHRLAFLYMEGVLPPDMVDHINRKRDDNRWCNLRHATRRVNCGNMETNTEYMGVYRNKKGNNWRVYTSLFDGKSVSLGHYKTHYAACYARWAHDVNLPDPSRF